MGFGSSEPRVTRQQQDSEHVAREVQLRPPRLGVALFNNPASPTSGVAATAGRPPIAFESRLELPSDALWISTATGATCAQNFRPADFLRVRPFAIAEDLGVVLDDVTGGLGECAKVIGSIRDIAAQSYPWSDFSVDWSHPNLSTAISKILPSRGAVPEAIGSPLNQAMQSFSVVQDKPSFGSYPMAQYSLRKNRLCYAQWLLSGLFPSGSWYFERGRLSLDQLLDPERPCIVEASVEFEGSALSDGVTPSLVAFGSSSFGGGREVIRRWISQPELAWLSRYARIHVSTALFCRGASPLPSEFALPPVLLVDPLLSLSVAAGVMAECHWNGVAAGSFARRSTSGGAVRFVTVNHPIGVWLRALDRAYCFAMAKHASARGFDVSSYGYGAVTVWSHKDELGPVFELSAELDCCHPNLAALSARMGFDPLGQ